jgi:hypothetical protein
MQYRLLEEWKVGCAVRTLNEVVERVESLLGHPQLLEEMRERTRAHCMRSASERIAGWLKGALDAQTTGPVHSNGSNRSSAMGD